MEGLIRRSPMKEDRRVTQFFHANEMACFLQLPMSQEVREYFASPFMTCCLLHEPSICCVMGRLMPGGAKEKGGFVIREGLRKGSSPVCPYDQGLYQLLDSPFHQLLHCLRGGRERRKFELRTRLL
jgi:hypothetical protein